MKKISGILLLLLTLLIMVLLFNTLTFKSKQAAVAPLPPMSLTDACVTHLSEAVRIRTISYDDDSRFDSLAFDSLLRFFHNRFPLCETRLKKHVISRYSIVYEWEGSDRNAKPILFVAHTDVVPAENAWKEPPFSGNIKDQYIWGRGTLDDKVSVLGLLEAAELLLSQEYTPKHTLYFAFGHDEETMGRNGAGKIEAWMRSRNIKAEFLLDEGSFITDGIVPGLKSPAALVGIAEKGMLTLRLSTAVEGGHSSMPQKETAVTVLASAIHRLQEHPFEAKITGPVEKFIEYIGPELPFFQKLAFANTWLLKPVILSTYQKFPSGNANVRTTMTPVIFRSGIKANVIPREAEAVINIRPLPGQDNRVIADEVRKRIHDDRIRIDVLTSLNPSPVSSATSEGFKKIDQTIRQVFPGTIVSPSLVIAGTDSKHYQGIAENIYRFLPIALKKEDLSRIHGSDERIAAEDYKKVIRFYYQLMKTI